MGFLAFDVFHTRVLDLNILLNFSLKLTETLSLLQNYISCSSHYLTGLWHPTTNLMLIHDPK